MSLLAERQEGGCACVYVFLKGGGVHVCMCFFNKGGLCTGKSDSLKASSKACVPKDP